MRVNKSEKSEMINQVLFGESFKVLQQDKKWSKIILNHDNYCGWIDNKQYLIIPKINNKFQISNKKYTNIKKIINSAVSKFTHDVKLKRYPTKKYSY